ncbi:MAG: hypothetical protein MK086_08525 [Flavobacteriales bacterium]|nr:hypothetical protein [Flavobacteriales bacterium]
MNNNYLFITFLLFLCSIIGCTYENEEELFPDELCGFPPELNYVNTIEVIVQNNCAISGCHTGNSPSGGLFLNSYEQVKVIAESGQMVDRTIIQGDMPPGSPLSNCEKQAIELWIAAGTPEN